MRPTVRPFAAAALTLALAAAVPAAGRAQAAPADQQVAAAVLPAPEGLRASATVLGYDAKGKLTTLRAGTGSLVCLADDPAAKNFHVACYQKELEPFMARGRALKAEGKSREAIDSIRQAEIGAGKLPMPKQPTALYELFGPEGSWTPAGGLSKEARPVYVLYIPYATEATTGLTQAGQKGGMPWIMYPGKPWAHIMITP